MKIISILLFSILLLGCNTSALAPNVEQKAQYSQKNVTRHHFKIVDFRNMLDKNSVKPIYIYLQALTSDVPSSELPRLKHLTQSVLSDFGSKVVVITSATEANKYFKNSRFYILEGGITAFDKSIESESSSINLSLKIGDSKNKDKFKNKKKLSQLIGDFYFKQNNIVTYKTTSSLNIREVNKGYKFGIDVYGVSLGVNSFKNIKDGLGLSVRKLIEASMIDLIGKAIGVQTYQVMPEIQAKKNATTDEHLSNYDFCSDVEKIVLYPMALHDERFNEFGMSYQSEMNKLKCFKELYTKSEQSQYKVRLNTVFGELTNRSQSYSNAKFIQRKINIDLGISRKNLLTKSVPNKRICDKPDNHDYCEFIENRVELEKVWR